MAHLLSLREGEEEVRGDWHISKPKIIVLDGHRRWIVQWNEPDGVNRKPKKHAAISEILDGCNELVQSIKFFKHLQKKHGIELSLCKIMKLTLFLFLLSLSAVQAQTTNIVWMRYTNGAVRNVVVSAPTNAPSVQLTNKEAWGWGSFSGFKTSSNSYDPPLLIYGMRDNNPTNCIIRTLMKPIITETNGEWTIKFKEDHPPSANAVGIRVSAMTDSQSPARYWSELKSKLAKQEGFTQLFGKIEQLKLASSDGKGINPPPMNEYQTILFKMGAMVGATLEREHSGYYTSGVALANEALRRYKAMEIEEPKK